MPDTTIPAVALALIERITEAIRHELGEEIDAYPGYQTPEGAAPLTRVFRAIVGLVLTAESVPAGNLTRTVSQTLRQAVAHRLQGDGYHDIQIKELIEQEPGGPDDWLVFLLLSSPQQIEPLLGSDQP